MRHVLGLAAGIVLCLFCDAPGVASAGLAAEDAPARITYLVVYRPGPSWLSGKTLAEQPLKEHGRYILSLYVKGSLKFAGPFADNTGGAAAFEAADGEQARAIVEGDPAVASGVFVADVHPWSLVNWEERAKK